MNPSIDPLTTSFRQLKFITGKTRGMKLPTAQALRSGGGAILFTHELSDATLTVYANGFYLYECSGKETVFAVDRIKQLVYEYQNNERRMIPESDFANGPCLIPLLAFADSRLASNLERYELYWQAFSLDDCNDGQLQGDTLPSAEGTVLYEDDLSRIRKNLTNLSDHQREIVRMYFFDRLSQKQIAARLHTTQQAISQTLAVAIKRLKKFF